MAYADADILDVAMSRTRLAAIEGAAARRAQFLRREYLERLGAVFAEDLRAVIRNVGDLRVVGGAGVDSGGGARVVAGHVEVQHGRGRCDRCRDRGQKGNHRRSLRVHLARRGNGVDIGSRLAILGGEARAARVVEIPRGIGECGTGCSGGPCTDPGGRRLWIVDGGRAGDAGADGHLGEVAVDHFGVRNRQCYTVAD